MFLATLQKWANEYNSIPKQFEFPLLVAGVFIFFGIHNFLQEAIQNVDGFTNDVMLGYFEVMGVAVCSFAERKYIAREHGRKAPLSAYPLLTLCLLASSGLSNMSLNYITFPTKVVFRSCKLIPTMFVAYLVHKKVFTCLEYLCATAACAGLVLFAAADWTTSPTFRPVGLTLVSLSVFADAILPNAQESLFKHGSSRLEVTLFTNIFTLTIMTISTFLSGDLGESLTMMLKNRTLATYFLVYTFVAYIAISFHMTVVKRYGGVAAVLVATGRKAMTLILSFLIFPKRFTWLYPAGALLVLGSLLVASLAKIRSKGKEPGLPTVHSNTGDSDAQLLLNGRSTSRRPSPHSS